MVVSLKLVANMRMMVFYCKINYTETERKPPFLSSLDLCIKEAVIRTHSWMDWLEVAVGLSE